MSAWGASWGDSWGDSWGATTAQRKQQAHFIPHPEGHTFDDWACRITEEFASVGVAMPPPEAQWRDWVCSLHYEPSLTAMNIPSPEGFSNWQAWASRFCDAVR